jgi:uncharacterized membrane protein
MTTVPESRRGLIHGTTAYVLWGLLPLYFHLISRVDAGEIVAQRVLWSVALLLVVVTLLRRLASLWQGLRTPRVLAMLAASAFFIAANWLIYVWAVLHHQVLATSMAYFLNPLINIAMGVALLGERLTRQQGVAVLLAGAGVVVQAWGADKPEPRLQFRVLWPYPQVGAGGPFRGSDNRDPAARPGGAGISCLAVGPRRYQLWTRAGGDGPAGARRGSDDHTTPAVCGCRA